MHFQPPVWVLQNNWCPNHNELGSWQLIVTSFSIRKSFYEILPSYLLKWNKINQFLSKYFTILWAKTFNPLRYFSDDFVVQPTCWTLATCFYVSYSNLLRKDKVARIFFMNPLKLSKSPLVKIMATKVCLLGTIWLGVLKHWDSPS